MANNSLKYRLWTQRIDRFKRSDLTLTQFCRNENVSIQTFYYWRKRIESTRTPINNSVSASEIGDVESPDAASSAMRFVIQFASVKVECHSNSELTLRTVLDWASSLGNPKHSSVFQQLHMDR
jgi:hypothetical protein